MLMAIGAILAGLVLLVWSADKFVEGSATTARHFGMPPLLIGMVVVGFGTSAPEMAVSALAASQGNPGLALGNAYGSNITNIALILGITALLAPIAVHSQVLRKELPILILVTAFAGWQLWDGELSRQDAVGLIVVFVALLGWSIYQGIKQPGDTMANEMTDELKAHAIPLRRAILWLVIGLTIVAVGTSLPELASSIIAARKGEHDLALGNILGSNLFNTLAVVGIAGLIAPMSVAPEVLSRDFPVMATLTLALFAMGYGFRGPGRINRFEGSGLLLAFVGYTVYLLAFSGA
ncbi:sodium:calcium antiporter [Marinobacter sp. Arc7-DN-1]|uniref:sodium:calcium antiporter n=1 Tax=Marinobacter sp. Arc7-DN-1 TaxID=2304594 RepID=UPI000E43D7A5|nr:calcium/sodium antiporter [Marinobacter sp. Arc7-DN-1]AXS83181.1 calcium/sodium antiporter [Marinobacter sp. Arc7-DN-1]